MKRREIEQAVSKLPPDELKHFRRWFDMFYAEVVDKQYVHDNVAEFTTSQSELGQHIDRLRGSLKGKGLLKSLMADKELEKKF